MKKPTSDLTHSQLCEKVAKKFSQRGGACITLWEYQSFATQEFPDVLIVYNTESVLYEIKMSRSDFLADSRKESRIRYSNKMWGRIYQETEKILEEGKRGYLRIGKKLVHELKRIQAVFHSEIKKFRMEVPHLGNQRFYVCPTEVIEVKDLPPGWGLIWYQDGKFVQKRGSEKFRSNLRDERNLLLHALRKWSSGYRDNILITDYRKSTGNNYDSPLEEKIELTQKFLETREEEN